MNRHHMSGSAALATPAWGAIVRSGLVVLLLATGLLFGAAGRTAPIHAAAPAGLAAGDWQAIQALLPASQQAYFKASNTGASDYFGSSVAVSGNTVVVGAPNEDSAATGVGGAEGNNSAPDSGAVYVFTRSGAAWSQQAYLKASNTEVGDVFGSSVAVDGDTIVVGAPYEDSAATGVDGDQINNNANSSGAAYVFTRSGAAWSQQAYIKASNPESVDAFAYSVAVSGNTIVVGAPNEDSAATGMGGDQANNNATDAGAAYVFTRSGAAWTQQAYLKASNTGAFDYFGWTVDVDGDTIVVGGNGEDSAATGVNGLEGNNSAPGAGAAYVFTRSGAVWSQQAYLKASNTEAGDAFGASVAVAGATIVIGTPNEDSAATGVGGNQNDNSLDRAGAAYVFARSGATWSQQAYLKAAVSGAFNRFGTSVAVDGATVIVGADYEAGRAYGFIRSGATWRSQASLKAAYTEVGDHFGWSVAVDGELVVVGVLYEDSAATGVGGAEDDNSTLDAGAVYAFTITQKVYLPRIAAASASAARPGPQLARFSR